MSDKKKKLYKVIQKMETLKVSQPHYEERVSDLISFIKGVAEKTSKLRVDTKRLKQEIDLQKKYLPKETGK